MIIGLGIDITEIKRISELSKRQPQFIERVLSPAEFDFYQQLSSKKQDSFLAGRFSAKESFGKAIGQGVGQQFSFQDLTILNDELGKPIATNDKFDGIIHISISHTDDLVFTEIILEKRKGAKP